MVDAIEFRCANIVPYPEPVAKKVASDKVRWSWLTVVDGTAPAASANPDIRNSAIDAHPR